MECCPNGKEYDKRKCWKKILTDISIGIFAIDKVGKGYDDSLWQDEEYVIHTGLNKIDQTNNFEENLRKLIKKALELIEKKAFILSFDDIDVDVNQGWNVMETLRRYFSDKHIISIVSGNIKLYGMLVRNELCKNLTMQDAQAKSLMANELESQYMLKLLNPSNRINLLSLHSLLQYKENTIKVKLNEQEKELKDAYAEFLTRFRITDSSSQKNFVEFLTSMSLRSQIHFIKDVWTSSNDHLPLDVFASRLYAANIDVEVLKLNAQITNIAILDYLRSKGNLPDCYLLLPTMPDKDTNSNFMALTLMECKHFATNPFLIFDYMLRIGYIRNVILPLEDVQQITNLCKYAGWNQIMSIKNSMGLTMAYIAGKKIGSLREHISLFGMEGKAKKTVENALDRVLKKESDSFTKLMAMFPFIRISHSKNNESRSYYSIFIVLAIISEILKCNDQEDMISRINDLKLFRSYQMPQDESNLRSESEIEEDTFGIDTTSEDITILAEKMFQWKKSYTDNIYLPPYTIGRIITRLYSSAMNVEINSVGQMMNVMVASFFNSCLIEEARTKIPSHEQSVINNNNPRKDTAVLMDNLGKTDIVDQLNFTKWIMGCPILNCFLENEAYNKVQSFVNNSTVIEKISSPVYELLCKIESKGRESKIEHKPPFSGEQKNGFDKTLNTLYANGITDEMIIDKIINAIIVDAIKYVQATDLFSSVRKDSMEHFKKNYQKRSKQLNNDTTE